MARVSYDPDISNSDFVPDETALDHPATTKAERRKALLFCINNSWAAEDLGCIERIETKTVSGWRMYPYRAPE